MNIQQLVLQGESQTLEFKTSFDRASIETLVAFANTQGGTLLIGVSDAGTFRGITLGKETPIRHNVHIGRFKTPDMIIDDRQFTDTLFEVVDQSMKFIVSHISVAFEFDGNASHR